MIQSDGKCRIDAIALGECAITLLGASPVLTAKFAFLNAESGERLGSGNRNQNWSEETLEALEGLVRSMERDLRDSLFSGSSTTMDSVVSDDNTQGDVPFEL